MMLATLAVALPGAERTGPSAVTLQGPLDPAQALQTFHLPPDFVIELVAAEPLVEDPVAIAWDERGRVFVAEMKDYPSRTGQLGRIKLLSDVDGDGRMDRATVFAEGLAFPTSVLPFRGGVLVTAAPDILFLADRDGDGRAEVREVVLTGFGEGNQQLRVNSLELGLDNWIHGANGRSNGAIRFPHQPADQALKLTNTDFRFRLGSAKAGIYSGEIERTSGFSQFGLAFDEWGQRFISWNTVHIRHVVLERRYLDRNPHFALSDPTAHIADADHGSAGRVYSRARTQVNFLREPAGYFNATSGIEIDRGGTFPAPYAGSAFVGEPLRNVVHRDELIPQGATFRARRGENEKASEFLASTDSWFRPVNLASGPDGALYVVDFYRRWIEHPAFVPKEFEPGIDFLDGTDRGRIYRVRPRAGPAFAGAPDLSRKTAGELIALLSSPNGWTRDTARRLLLERPDRAFVPQLVTTAAGAASPHARLQALAVLEGAGILNPAAGGNPEPALAVLSRALRDQHPRVREFAIRLAERFPSLGRDVAALADDADPRIRFQAAATLGFFDDVSPLVRIAARDLDDPWIQAAILSGLNEQAGEFLRQWLVQSPAGVMPTASETKLLVAVARIAAAADQQPLAWPATLTWTEPSPLNLRVLAVEAGINHPPAGTALALARRLANDPAQPVHFRQLCVTLLARAPSPDDLGQLVHLLTPQTPAELQQTIVESLGKLASPEIPGLLLARWPEATQPLRRLIFQTLIANGEGTEAILGALERQQVAPGEMEPLWRIRMLRTSDAGRRERAAKILGPTAAGREAVVDRYRRSLDLVGDARRGETVFLRTCATCHRMRGQGGAVGPDLSAIASRPSSQLLEDILDPNRQASPDFIAYSLTTHAGDAYLGVIVAETEAGITLRQLDAREVVVERSQVKSLQSTARSLMPDGLEANLQPHDMADLLAFLRSD